MQSQLAQKHFFRHSPSFPCISKLHTSKSSTGRPFPKHFDFQFPVDSSCEIYDILRPRMWNSKSHPAFKFHIPVFCPVLEYILKKSRSLHGQYLCSEVQSNATWFLIFLSNSFKAVHYCTEQTLWVAINPCIYVCCFSCWTQSNQKGIKIQNDLLLDRDTHW